MVVAYLNKVNLYLNPSFTGGTTPHETLVPECIGSNPFLQDMVVAYPNKVNLYLNPSFTGGTTPHETLVPECIGSKPSFKTWWLPISIR